MDSGANGSMAGDDILITAYHDHDRAQVTGIAGNSLDDLRKVTAAGIIESTEASKFRRSLIVSVDGLKSDVRTGRCTFIW